MKKLLLAIVFLPAFAAVSVKAQTGVAAPEPRTAEIKQTSARSGSEVEDAKEAEAAFRDFQREPLAVNPNNLTGTQIEELRRDFLPAIKPYLIEKGAYPERLARIAEPIFRLHNTGKSKTVVFKNRVPIILTWKETFVTLSTRAMDLLTDDEIAALVAHETGHLYFAAALGRARTEKNDRQARIIELQCDLAAFTGLAKLGIAPENLIRAVEKLIEERRRLDIKSFEAGSSSLGSRKAVLKLYLSKEKTVPRDDRR